jgi:hypothetical protein
LGVPIKAGFEGLFNVIGDRDLPIRGAVSCIRAFHRKVKCRGELFVAAIILRLGKTLAIAIEDARFENFAD